MKSQYTITSLVCLLFAALTAHAQVDVKWKFKQDERFFVREEIVQKMTMTFQGAPIPSDLKTITVYSFTVKKVNKEKDEVILEQKYESIETKSSTDQKMFDSLAGLLKDSTFTITLQGGKIVKFDGYDDLSKKFSKLSETSAKMMKAVVPEESLKLGPAQLFAFGPDKPVNKGDAAWARTFVMPMGPVGTFTAKNEYSYGGKGTETGDRGLELLAIKPSMTYTKPIAGDSPFPFKIVNGAMEAKDASGAMFFDAARGRLARYEMTMKVEGTITVEAGDKKSEIGLKQEQTVKSQVLDKAP